MKLLALVSVLTTTLLAPVCEARSLRTYESHNLTTVMIDGKKTDYAGRLTINYVENKISVEFGKDICGHYADLPAGAFRCMAMPIPVAQFEVPLQKRANSCGSIVLSGIEDLRRVDGPRTEIVAMNHAGRMCEDYRPYGIEVRVKSVSPFGGEKNYFLSK